MGSRRVVTEGFHRRVRAVVRLVPPGTVATYGDVATALGASSVARHVGWALAALPEGSDVPWHRIVNAQGAISARSEGEGDPLQRLLLEAEGVTFDARGRVDLRQYRHRLDPEAAAAALALLPP